MESKSVIKVGTVVVLALVLGAALYFYLAHLNPNTYRVYVTFQDTQGLVPQSPVRMQGVNIGEVYSITLDTTKRPPLPVVTLQIENKYHIPVGSRFKIDAGLFIPNPIVDVTPGTSLQTLAMDGTAHVRGEPPAAGPQELMTRVNTEFTTLHNTLVKTTGKIDNLLDQTSQFVRTANAAAVSGKNLIADPRLHTSLIQTVSNFQDASAQIKRTAGQAGTELHAMLQSSRGSVQRITGKLGDVLTRLDDTIGNANDIVKRLTEQVTDPRFQQSLQDTAEMARATIARFNQVASDLDQLLGDPALQGNLKQTVANLSGVTRSGEQTLDKVNTLLDRLLGVKGGHTRFPPVTVMANVSQQFNPGHLRLDLDARVPIGAENFIDAGLYDLGQTTRFNLQGGSVLTKYLTARYGLYASKIGAGIEWTPETVFGLRADVWDTNHPRLDLRGLFRVNKDSSFWLGGDNLLRQPYPILGFQFTH